MHTSSEMLFCKHWFAFRGSSKIGTVNRSWETNCFEIRIVSFSQVTFAQHYHIRVTFSLKNSLWPDSGAYFVCLRNLSVWTCSKRVLYHFCIFLTREIAFCKSYSEPEFLNLTHKKSESLGDKKLFHCFENSLSYSFIVLLLPKRLKCLRLFGCQRTLTCFTWLQHYNATVL